MKKIYSLAIGVIGLTSISMAQCTITSSSVVPTGMTVNTTATGTGAAVPAYAWDWGDASSPTTTQNASHTYSVPGVYNVCVVYIDITNTTCVDSACHTVTVTTVGISEANGGVNTIAATPNPFGASTTFNINLAQNADVEISVYDVTGKKVETVKDEEMTAGSHSIVWTPETLAEGVYFVQMVIDGEVQTRKIVHTGNE